MDCCGGANPFRLCTGLRVFGYAMLLLFAAIVSVSYYAVVIVAWGPPLVHRSSMPISILSLFILLAFHLLLVLLIWSYLMVVFRDPGTVPTSWRPLLEGENPGMTNSAVVTDYSSTEPGVSDLHRSEEFRRHNSGYCVHCQHGKPPRCHHCSICQRCVLKMDHHCIWVVNCVGARNYKFFLLFLGYTFLEAILDTLVLLPHFIKFFGDARNHSSSPGGLAVTFLAFVLNVAFALSLLCFIVLHISLLLSNTTTIEVYEKKIVDTWKYDLGKARNFEQVFGTNKILWFFPLFSSEDLENLHVLQGLEFPTRSDVKTGRQGITRSKMPKLNLFSTPPYHAKLAPHFAAPIHLTMQNRHPILATTTMEEKSPTYMASHDCN